MLNSRLLSSLRVKYNSLAHRDRIAILAVAVAVFIFVWFQLVFFPLADKEKILSGVNKSKEEELIELKKIVAQYHLSKKGENTRHSPQIDKSFNLFSVLEKLATENGIMDKVDYMRPGNIKLDERRSERWVELKLSQVTVKDLVNYLYGLKSSHESIYIKRLSAKRDGDYLRLVLQPAITIVN